MLLILFKKERLVNIMNLKNNELNSELKKLDNMEKEWTDKLNEELKTEEEIEGIIDYITNKLILGGKARAIVDEKNFIIGSRVVKLPNEITENDTKKQIMVKTTVLIITNIDKYKLLEEKYIPAMVKADYDERYDVKANFRVAVEGWVRHITGTIKPETLDK